MERMECNLQGNLPKHLSGDVSCRKIIVLIDEDGVAIAETVLTLFSWKGVSLALGSCYKPIVLRLYIFMNYSQFPCHSFVQYYVSPIFPFFISFLQ